MKEFFLKDLEAVATYILQTADTKTLLFFGDMGVGKTTLIKELTKQLGSQDQSSSPTFSLVNEYQNVHGQIVYHFDFYRINHEEEALDIGLDEYLYSDAWCFIEWPERISSLLDTQVTNVNISIDLDSQARTIEVIK